LWAAQRRAKGWRTKTSRIGQFAPVFFVAILAILLARAAPAGATGSRGQFMGSPMQEGVLAGDRQRTPAVASSLQCGAWTVVNSPNETQVSFLKGVAAVSASDVWAVGGFASFRLPDTLSENWNGAGWNIVPSPNPLGFGGLSAVAAVAANNVWAVGPTIDHWNGNQWVANPAAGNLYGVGAISANDIWAVGQAINLSGSYIAVSEHWNGSQWSVIPTPSPGSYFNDLTGVATIAPNDVWAVGSYGPEFGPQRTLIEHWDGVKWSVVSSPSPGIANYYLNGVTAVSANDVWAVGIGNSALIEHWNGTSWSIISNPGSGTLNGVAAVSVNNVWAVGYNGSSTGGPASTLIEHWNGTSWSIVSSPNPSYRNILDGVAAVPGTRDGVVAVGSAGSSNTTAQTLTMYDC
jgi:hypothetical protein